MSQPSKSHLVNSKYVLVTGIAVVLSWVLHEFAHWTAGTLLGYEMGMTFNKTFPVSGKFTTDFDYQVVSAAGPVFTLIEALIIFFVMRRKKIISLYPFLFTCFYMRLLAAAIGVQNPNDEARISKSIGLGTYTLPIIISIILLFLVFKISRKYKFSVKFNLINIGLVMLFSSIIILTDQFFHIRLL